MIYALLSTLCSVSLFVLFRSFGRWQVNRFQAIVVNYAVCVLTGWVVSPPPAHVLQGVPAWWAFPLAIGTGFVITFNLMGATVEKAGLTAATIAGKMSLVIPVALSLWVFQYKADGAYHYLQFVGMGLALVALALATWKSPRTQTGTSPSLWIWLLPALVFVNSGLLDSSINWANSRYVSAEEQGLFSISLFGVAAAVGAVLLAIELLRGRQQLAWRHALAGLVLGVPNYFSVYFLLKALSQFDNDGAILFPVVNILTILISAGTDFFLFREKLSRLNILGIILAVVSIVLLSWD